MADAASVISGKTLSYMSHSCTDVPVHFSSHNIHRIDLSDNNLGSLAGLEQFTALEELILDQNGLTDACFHSLPHLPLLHTLSLNKNSIKDLESLLKIVKERLPSLIYLSLLCNEACPDQMSGQDKDEEDYRRYRLYVLFYLPQLKFLDFSPVKPSERTEAAQKGAYLQVKRPAEDVFQIKDNLPEVTRSSPIFQEEYQPLPQDLRGADADGTATFGKCKYVYYGRHSEGNRFIRNNDL